MGVFGLDQTASNRLQAIDPDLVLHPLGAKVDGADRENQLHPQSGLLGLSG